VDEKKGCAPLTILVTAPGCTAINPCTINYGDGTPVVQNSFLHTYNNPGVYILNLQPTGSAADQITITVDQNIQPNFEIYACSASGVRVQVTDNNYDQYKIDFENDNTPEFTLPGPSPLTPSHTYAPGTYTIAVRGQDLASALNNCTPRTQSFTTLPFLPAPSINTLTSIDAANVTLDFTTAVNIQYRMEISVNGGPFQVYKTLFGVNTLAVTDLKLDENLYCFRLGAYSPCNGVSSYSTTICTNRLVVTAQSDAITVTSNAGSGIVNYSIDRDGLPYQTGRTSPIFPDTDVECKKTYCYRVTSNYPGGRKSISLEKCAKAFSTTIPTPIDDVTATVGDGGATLTWTQDPLFTPTGYFVNRASVGSAFNFYTITPASPYTDNIYTTSGRYCYEINYVDQCDNASNKGVVVCPVRLTGSLDINNTITLGWSSYRGFKNGVKNYVLEKYNLSGGIIASLTTNDTTFIDSAPDATNQYQRYVVRAIPNTVGMAQGVSNELEFIKNANLYSPTAFTPNNDNLNDGFIVSGQFIVKIKMNIFDRWGALLFSTSKNEPWDGNAFGKPMPPSTYIWKVEITDRAGRTFSQEGTVALFRN